MRTIEQYLDHVEIMNTMDVLIICLTVLNLFIFCVMAIQISEDNAKDDKPKDDDGAI